jgi:ABC-2 type transport system permease protein
MKRILLYIRLYFVLRSKEVQKRLGDKFDFVIYIFCDAVIQLSGVVFFYALFTNIPALNGWSFHQTILLYGMFQLSYGLTGFLFHALYDFGWVLASGEFDGILMRPLGSVFQLLCRGLGDIGGVLLGGVLVVYAAVNSVFPVTLTNILMIGFSLLCSITLFVCFYVLAASTSFWMDNASGSLLRVLNLCSDYARYPLNIFAKAIKTVLTWVLPFGFIGFYPASYLLGNEWRYYILALPGMVVIFLLLAVIVWKRGVLRYRGSGN